MTTARDQTIDIAKGIAIISIVLGHVIRGVVTPEQLEGGAFAAVDNILYSFHLAVFAFLSGLFVQRAVSRRGARPYLKSRVALLLYLYFVWTLIQVAVKLLTGRLANEPIGLFEAASSFWLADTQMWFFGFLVFATVYSVLIKPWGKAAPFSLVAAAALSLAFWGTSLPGLLDLSSFLGTQGWGLLIFFVVGVALRHDRLTDLLGGRARTFSVFFLSAAVFVATWTWLGPSNPTEWADRTVFSVATGLLATSSGVVAVLTAAAAVKKLAAAQWLGLVGQRSLEIFVAHIIFASGTRIAGSSQMKV